MQLIPVNSSLVSAYAVNEDRTHLRLIVKGKQLDYQNADPTFVAEFEAAESKGKFFNARMRKQKQTEDAA